MNDTTPKVTGIGGIFFRSRDPKELKEWYGKNLGLEITAYGSIFHYRNADNPEQTSSVVWSPFKEDTDYFDPSKKEYMINYTVKNIEGMVERLREKGVVIVDDIQSSEYGKFVHVMDAEGNKIELWEP